MSALDVHYITIEEKNKLRLDHVIFIVWTLIDHRPELSTN